jgi:hypothetical protein
MQSELITQRIRHLVEDGGLFDDPVSELRRDLRIALAVIAVSAVVCALELGWIAFH